jgi:peptide-methionine (S)-S-oxide reductase
MALAEQSKQQRQKALGEDKAIVTPIIAAGKFYPAEAYHQDYYRKNPLRYNYYRRGCGRDIRLEQLWGPPEKTH